MSNWGSELNTAIVAAEKAAVVLKNYFGKVEKIRKKADFSLVSEADQDSEDIIRSFIHAEFPQDEFLGEEKGLSIRGNRRRWIVDPLDGTTNFIHGFPFFAVSIALVVDDEPVVGVVNAPLLNRIYVCSLDGGAWLNGTKLQVSETKTIEDSLVATGFVYTDPKELDQQISIFKRFVQKSAGVRRPGAAALDLCCVADGEFDAYWERGIKSWDVAAGALLIKEAGGRVSDYKGQKFQIDCGDILGSNGHLHEKMLSEIFLASQPDLGR